MTSPIQTKTLRKRRRSLLIFAQKLEFHSHLIYISEIVFVTSFPPLITTLLSIAVAVWPKFHSFNYISGHTAFYFAWHFPRFPANRSFFAIWTWCKLCKIGKDFPSLSHWQGRIFEFTQFWNRLTTVWNRLIFINGIDSTEI